MFTVPETIGKMLEHTLSDKNVNSKCWFKNHWLPTRIFGTHFNQGCKLSAMTISIVMTISNKLGDLDLVHICTVTTGYKLFDRELPGVNT